MNDRKAQICTNDKWFDIAYKDLKEGDKFRLLDTNGDVVMDSRGRKTYIAASSIIDSYGDIAINVY